MNKLIPSTKSLSKIILTSVFIMTCATTTADTSDAMSFFVTSIGSGAGGNLGGLKGADAHCQTLATSASSSKKQWRAYLSIEGENARDRIGAGPWVNAKGVTIANDVNDLHSENNKINKENALTESGAIITGREDKLNLHDILTGTNKDGSAATANCNNWTTSDTTSTAIVGHHDKKGPAGRISWNSAHESLGCGVTELKQTGGGGFFYCFAKD